MSALLGRIPSAVGYQPTLATDMGQLQERITSTTKGSITSVQAIYVPADDLTDPAPAASFAHLDAQTVLNRAISERASIRPSTRSTRPRASLIRTSSARTTTASRAAFRRSCRSTSRCRTSSPFSAWTNCPKTTNSSSPRARKIERFLSQPFFVAAQFTNLDGQFVDVKDTVQGFKEILEGKHDDIPSRPSSMCGKIDDVIAKAQKMAAEAA